MHVNEPFKESLKSRTDCHVNSDEYKPLEWLIFYLLIPL